MTKQATARSAKRTTVQAAKAKQAAAKARAAAKLAQTVHSQRMALATATVGEVAAVPIKKNDAALNKAIQSRKAKRVAKAADAQKLKVVDAKTGTRQVKAVVLARKAAARKAAAIQKQAAKQAAAAKKAAIAKKAAAKRAAVARLRIAAKKAAARVTTRNVEQQTKGAARSLSKAATLLTDATQQVQASGRRAHVVHQVVQKLQERLADLTATGTMQRKAADAVKDLAGYTHRLMATVQKTLQKTRRAARDVKSASVAVRSGRAHVKKWQQPVPVKDMLRAKQGSLKFTRQAAAKVCTVSLRCWLTLRLPRVSSFIPHSLSFNLSRPTKPQPRRSECWPRHNRWPRPRRRLVARPNSSSRLPTSLLTNIKLAGHASWHSTVRHPLTRCCWHRPFGCKPRPSRAAA